MFKLLKLLQTNESQQPFRKHQAHQLYVKSSTPAAGLSADPITST